jgi:CcmD family protein
MHQEGLGFVIAAYAATWVAVLGYLVWLRGALRRARAQYEKSGGTQRVIRYLRWRRSAAKAPSSR